MRDLLLQEAERSLYLDDEDDDGEDPVLVWGTNVARRTVASRARRFLRGYTEPGASEPKYVELIRQACAPESNPAGNQLMCK